MSVIRASNAVGALVFSTLLATSAAQANIQVTSTIDDLQVEITNAQGVKTFLPFTSTTGDTRWRPQAGVGAAWIDDLALGVAQTADFSGTPSSARASGSTLFGTLGATGTSAAQGLSFVGQFASSVPRFPPPDSGINLGGVTATASLYPSVAWGALAAGDPDMFFKAPVHGGLWLPAKSTATVSGSLGLDASVSLGDLQVDPGRVKLTSNASMVVGVYRVVDGGTLEGALKDPQGEQQEQLAWNVYSIPDLGEVDLRPLKEHKAFQLDVQNTSDQGLWLIVGASMNVDTTQTILPVGGLVPEPESWALVVAGLIVVGLAKRSAQRARN